MAIRYYPNRVYRSKPPKVDVEMSTKKLSYLSGQSDITSSPLDLVISSSSDWKLCSVSAGFSNSTARDYKISVVNGRKVVKNLNDYMWIGHSSMGKVLVTIPPGFYTGSDLATALKTELDDKFNPIIWSVSYDPSSGLFSIAPDSGLVRYLNVNNSSPFNIKDSICGHLFGFEADASLSASISSDTPVYALNLNVDVLSLTGDTDASVFYGYSHELSIDQGIKISTSTAAVNVEYVVVFEKDINGLS